MTKRAFGTSLRAGILAIAALLAGCASRPAPPPALTAAPAPLPAVPRPTPPAGAAANVAVPAIGEDGAYVTINHGLTASATIWHVRSALNVAALACRGEAEAAIVANYNAMLASKKAVLAAALASAEADARATAGKDWRDAQDRRMTAVYNFFALPPAKPGFCAVAEAVVAEAAATPPAAFAAFAPAALARLEAPFIDFYRSYDAYRRDLAAWDAGDRTAGAQLAYAPVAQIIAWSPGAPDDRRFASVETGR